ncbi:MAG: choice-of-anchor B family protein [Candidatus Neomarinimicrobiota bacterium]
MIHYLSFFLLPVLLFAENKLHDEDPKGRPHHALSYGVLGSVAINDGTVFVGQTGSSLNNGSVYIYSYDKTGSLITNQIFPDFGNHVEFDFGYSVSVNEDVMIVGAPSRAEKGTGRAFIYRKSMTNQWNLVQEIIPNENDWTTDFGSEVVVSGRFMMIGDRYARDERGLIYAMRFDEKTNKWTKLDPVWSDQALSHGLFGHSIDIHDNHAIIGSKNGNIAVEYSYNEALNKWDHGQVFSPQKLQNSGRFGFSVELTDHHLFIGYPGFDRKGEVHVFTRESNTWDLNQTLSVSDDNKEQFFGASISFSDGDLAVGNFNGEKVFTFNLNSENRFEKSALLAPENLPGSKFGRSLDIADDIILVGATYGELAYFYKKQNGSWLMSDIFSSSKGNKSQTGQIFPCSAGNIDNYYPEGGMSNLRYPCSGIDLYAFISPNDLGGNELNDIWGWTDPATNREYALVGLTNGLSFVDITEPLYTKVLGHLPTQTRTSAWRDIKVYKNHAFVVADNVGNHGVQVFDLTQLRGVTSFTTFQPNTVYDQVGSVHNIAINEETGYAYAVGTDGCGAHIINVQDPKNPTYAGCLKDTDTGRRGDGYVHDGQFVIYRGPDSDYYGKEIAFTCNETALSIADISDKNNLKIISNYQTDYSGARYIHQGWLSEDHRYFYVNDELNERNGIDTYQNTFIFDVTDLDNPKVAGFYNSNLRTIDHNNYVVDTLMFQSNYSTGLRVLSIADPINPREIAFFDTYPSGNKVSFVGSWSNYPYFASKTIVVSSIEEGLYVLKINEGEDLSIESSYPVPSTFTLEQNYPNPFNPTTNINYNLSSDGYVSLIVFNAAGQVVKVLQEGFQTKGSFKASFNGAELPSGIYFYQLKTDNGLQTRKMSLLK